MFPYKQPHRRTSEVSLLLCGYIVLGRFFTAPFLNKYHRSLPTAVTGGEVKRSQSAHSVVIMLFKGDSTSAFGVPVKRGSIHARKIKLIHHAGSIAGLRCLGCALYIGGVVDA